MRWIYPSENGFVYRFVYALFTGLLTAKIQQPCGFLAFVNHVNKKIEENKLVQQSALRLQKKFSHACLHEFVYTTKNGRALLDNPCEMDYTTNRKGAGCKMVSTYSGSKKD